MSEGPGSQEADAELDLGDGAFLLLAGPSGAPWRDAAFEVAECLGQPFAAYTVGPDGDLRDEAGAWSRAAGTGDAGALLVRPGGRAVHCYCVKAKDPSLPSGDRIAHLLLALREDEAGFATVANRAFAGARWRVRRRLPAAIRPALDRAGELAAAPR